MKHIKLIDLALGAFALLFAAACLLIAAPAFATEQPKGPPKVPPGHMHMTAPGASSTSSATAAPSTSSATGGSVGAIDLSLMNAPAGVDTSTRTGNTYVFPAPAAAAPLPSGLCPQGDSESFSVVWGFISYAKSSTRTEHACLDKLIAYMRETAPKPAAAPVVNYITNPPAECPKAAPAKKSPKKAAKPAAICKTT